MRRLGAVFLLLTGLILTGLWLDYRHAIDAPLENAETVDFEIAKGQSLASIAGALRERGLIDKPHWFRVLAWQLGIATRLKYGEYEIPPEVTPRRLLELFASGKVKQYSLTFIEGWRFQQMVELLQRHPALSHQLAAQSADEIMSLLGASGENAEGRFFPDTYFFTKGTSELDLLKRSYQKMRTLLDEEWRNRSQGLPLRSPDEALVLASLVEKETARPEERAQIAGVFLRRLDRNMLLQTDPAVIYGMGEAYAGNVRKEDLARDTPYNTYVHAGLPPTPIALPGAGAIRAALHPDGGNSLFFVARGDGSHVFSSSLAEHNKAVDQFQRNRHD
ncbi:MAG: endolytic transglycosylase MltG [Methylococcaceae bacterium]|nr:endolytic transglycosylase MltG [Methylococcaceae bacterium]